MDVIIVGAGNMARGIGYRLAAGGHSVTFVDRTPAKAEALVVAMQQIATLTGIPTRLEQVGVQESDLDRLADDAMLQTRLLGNNPRELTRADAYAIYQAAL